MKKRIIIMALCLVTAFMLCSCPMIVIDNRFHATVPSISVQPQDAFITRGTSKSLSIKASAEKSYSAKEGIPAEPVEESNVFSPTLSYQWYVTNDKSKDGEAISGATSDSCNINTSAEGSYYYYCVVTNTIKDNKDRGKKTATEKSAFAKVIVTTIGSKYPDAENPVGVVFMINTEKNWIKIVSLNEETTKVWSSSPRSFGTKSEYTGHYNQSLIENSGSFSGDIAAAYWCSDRTPRENEYEKDGNIWSLPAIEELGAIYTNLEAVNASLDTKIKTDTASWYWSSTAEFDSTGAETNYAKIFKFCDNDGDDHRGHELKTTQSTNSKVRAVLKIAL